MGKWFRFPNAIIGITRFRVVRPGVMCARALYEKGYAMIKIHLYPYNSPLTKNCYEFRANATLKFIFPKQEVEKGGIDMVLKHIADTVSTDITNAGVQIHLRTYEEETKNA